MQSKDDLVSCYSSLFPDWDGSSCSRPCSQQRSRQSCTIHQLCRQIEPPFQQAYEDVQHALTDRSTQIRKRRAVAFSRQVAQTERVVKRTPLRTQSLVPVTAAAVVKVSDRYHAVIKLTLPNRYLPAAPPSVG